MNAERVTTFRAEFSGFLKILKKVQIQPVTVPPSAQYLELDAALRGRRAGLARGFQLSGIFRKSQGLERRENSILRRIF
jgi:hypothetical protein